METIALLRAKFYSLFFPIGRGTLIMKDFDVRHPEKLSIGDRCFINKHFFVVASGGISIGDDVLIGPRVTILSENHTFENLREAIMNQKLEKKPVFIGNNVWIGINVVILPGVKIGDGCVIAAGAVVTKSFGKNQVLGGVPAKLIKTRE